MSKRDIRLHQYISNFQSPILSFSSVNCFLTDKITLFFINNISNFESLLLSFSSYLTLLIVWYIHVILKCLDNIYFGQFTKRKCCGRGEWMPSSIILQKITTVNSTRGRMKIAYGLRMRKGWGPLTHHGASLLLRV